MDKADGFPLVCTDCETVALLPYCTEARTEVSLTPALGWEFPPWRCPDCAAAIRALNPKQQEK
jgi:hypothetical protein